MPQEGDSMKTKRSMKERDCHLCKGKIEKGEQYATKSISAGQTCTWGRDDRPVEEIPAWAWSPYRIKVAVCDPCANPEGGKDG